MGFKDDLQRLSAQIAERMGHVVNEEMAKQVLILPFLKVLGFDVYNPLEIRPEYTADFGKKKGEKVDYAIFKDGTPVMFLEAKALSEELGNHDAQLARYFNSTPQVRFAILTNGVTYKFFSDLNASNIMDQSPFLIIDMTNLTATDTEVLANFKKDSFEAEALVKYAEELVYTSNINAKLKDLFRNPPDDFIRYLVKDFSDTRVTSAVIERFRPIIKKSISLALIDMVSQGLFPQESGSEDPGSGQNPPADIPQSAEASPPPSDIGGKSVITTEEELESFAMIKKILEKNGKDVSELGGKDTTIYYGIFVKSVFRWFIRLNLDSANKQVITKLRVEEAQQLAKGFMVDQAPKGIGESRVYIDSHNDLARLEPLILACFDSVTTAE